MKMHPIFAALGAAATLCAMPAMASDAAIRFDGGIGVQPFRSAAGVPTLNTVAGVPPGGTPWLMSSFKGSVNSSGRLRARGTGVILAGGDNVGTRGGPRQVVASLFCRNAPVAPAVAGTLQTVPYNSATVDLDADGDFRIDSLLTNASGATPPLDCGDAIDNRPVLLIRSVTPANPTTGAPATPGSWFAAGIIAPRDDDRGHDRD